MRVMWRVLAGAVCFAAISQVSGATTLQLTGTGGTAVNVGSESVYVYPYDFSVNGSSATTQLMCLSFNDEITVGESWTVNADTIAQAANGNSALQTAYEEDAWLYSQITPSTSQSQEALIQFAVWDILDPSGVGVRYRPLLDSEFVRHPEPHWSGFDRGGKREPRLLQPVCGLRSRSRFELLHLGQWISGRASADLCRHGAHAGARKPGAAGNRTAGTGRSCSPQNAEGLGFRQC